MRRTALLAAMLFCSSRCSRSREVQPTAAASAASAAKERDASVISAAADAGSNAPASTMVATAEPPSPEPRLSAALGGGLVAVFLEAVESRRAADGALTLYASEPILTVGHSVKIDALSVTARRSVAAHYAIGDAEGHTCEGAMESVAIIYRTPSDDSPRSAVPVRAQLRIRRLRSTQHERRLANRTR